MHMMVIHVDPQIWKELQGNPAPPREQSRQGLERD
jgi:hypothetical protein